MNDDEDDGEEIFATEYVRSPLETLCFVGYLESLRLYVGESGLDPVSIAGRTVECRRFLRAGQPFDTERQQKAIVAAMLCLPAHLLHGSITPTLAALDFLDSVENDASSFEGND